MDMRFEGVTIFGVQGITLVERSVEADRGSAIDKQGVQECSTERRYFWALPTESVGHKLGMCSFEGYECS